MSHLTEEQLEEMLILGGNEPEHLSVCSECRQRLSEKQALRQRLQTAFRSIQAPSGLAERITSQCTAMEGVATKERSLPVKQTLWLRWAPRLIWPAIAAAVMIGVIALFYVAGTSMESTAQAALVQVHESNMSSGSKLFTDNDPAKMASYLQSQAGFTPRVPQPVKGVTLRGCCAQPYCRSRAACYVLDTAEGAISIVVISDHPQSLGMSRQTGCAMCGECTCWMKSFGNVNVAAIRQGGYSYYALGHMSQARLMEVLMSAYPSSGH